MAFFFEGAPAAQHSEGMSEAPSPSYVSDFLATSDGLALTKAFMEIKEPKLRVPRAGRPGDPCDGAYLCETNTCVNQQCRANPNVDATPVFDYRLLNKALVEKRAHGAPA